MSGTTIRAATEADLPAILAIYNEVIATTTAVYTETPTDLAERAAWFAAKAEAGWPVLAAERDGALAGFATFGPFRAWPCYAGTVEHSVHIRHDRRGQGVGRRLLEALIALASARGFHVMIAGIDADNAASIALHKSLGFTTGGRLGEVGRKFDRWLDLEFLQRRL